VIKRLAQTHPGGFCMPVSGAIISSFQNMNAVILQNFQDMGGW